MAPGGEARVYVGISSYWYRSMRQVAHSPVKCNGEIFGVEENLTRSSVAEYLSGARVEFILDPLDIGI
jgi:hypothetical protein